uniref:ENTH domain-containing protein n=1 Tax=Panagrellus redivivus TaxID=6233 RepID=A0A7E4VLZ2_PANRE
MSISTIKRQVKNVAYNFSDAQVKVREATSNDPWGPTTALMSEIADMTNNPLAFTEIMSMLWKRLNDHGKNWRHVYKSLVLLDYLIKCGSDKVAAQCRENIYSIETLKDFQHIEENRDQGLNVREKAKQMVILLNDEERLKSERTRFQNTRKRFMAHAATMSDGNQRNARSTFVGDSELEEARPSSIGEEEMQLQIALALSREESAKEEEMRKGDDIRLQIALEESKRNEKAAANGANAFGPSDAFGASSGFGFESSDAFAAPPPAASKAPPKSGLESALEDLMELNLGGPAPTSTNAPTLSDPWGAPATGLNDPWSAPPPAIAPPKPKNTANNGIYPDLMGPVPTAATNDPWSTPAVTTSSSSGFGSTTASNDPWSALSAPAAAPSAPADDPWASAFSQPKSTPANDPWLLPAAPQPLASQPLGADSTGSRAVSKTPESFLGESSSLVNLDNLMGPAPSSIPARPGSNPFVAPGSTTNPFAVPKTSAPSINDLMAQRSDPYGSNKAATNPFAAK